MGLFSDFLNSRKKAQEDKSKVAALLAEIQAAAADMDDDEKQALVQYAQSLAQPPAQDGAQGENTPSQTPPAPQTPAQGQQGNPAPTGAQGNQPANPPAQGNQPAANPQGQPPAQDGAQGANTPQGQGQSTQTPAQGQQGNPAPTGAQQGQGNQPANPPASPQDNQPAVGQQGQAQPAVDLANPQSLERLTNEQMMELISKDPDTTMAKILEHAKIA